MQSSPERINDKIKIEFNVPRIVKIMLEIPRVSGSTQYPARGKLNSLSNVL